MSERCKDCQHWKRGYLLQGMKVPDFCTRHFFSQRGDELACEQFAQKEGDGNDG